MALNVLYIFEIQLDYVLNTSYIKSNAPIIHIHIIHSYILVCPHYFKNIFNGP